MNLISPILKVLLVAATPISELRGSIPLALGAYHFTIWKAFFYSVLGNMIPVIFILWFLDPLSKFLIARFKIADKFFTWLFERTRKNNAEKFGRWGDLALAIFVAIPLPMTGAWSGAVAAYVFGIPYKRALLAILGGVIGAGIIVTLTYTGAVSLFF